MGGGDGEENLTPPISIKLHAEFHRDLYERFGAKEDYIAWQALSGRITSEEARLMAAKAGQEKSEKYKNREFKDHLDKVRTQESCSRGGKAASKSLVAWIKANKEKHRQTCSKNGKVKRNKIPHEYLGVVYESKKSLQEATKLSNTGFYSKLRKGEIVRLIKEIEE
jgi:phosphoribosyl-AMP cyclohydrolase